MLPEPKIFIRISNDCVRAPEVDYYWPQSCPQGAPRRPQRNFSDLDPPEPRDHGPKTLFSRRKIEIFMFKGVMIAQVLNKKYAGR